MAETSNLLVSGRGLVALWATASALRSDTALASEREASPSVGTHTLAHTRAM